MINIRINSQNYDVEKDITILEACQRVGIYIPTLCYHEDLPPAAICGLCVVKVNGTSYSYSCLTKAKQGMIIDTTSPDVIAKAQQNFYQFMDMPVLPRSKDIEDVMQYLTQKTAIRVRKAEKTNGVTFQPKECVNCGRCVRMCSDIIDIGALDDSTVPLRHGSCIQCGQCSLVCPTDGFIETPSTPYVLRALAQGKVTVLLIDPTALVSIGENFGDDIGTEAIKKVVGVAKALGFKYVFDARYAIDMVTLGQASELIERIDNRKSLPVFSSTCPAWVNFIEKNYPELIPHFSTNVSPDVAFARLLRARFASKKRIKADDLYIVSLTPCVAAKDEIKRMQLSNDLNAVISIREFIKMMSQFAIEWNTTKGEDFDEPYKVVSGVSTLYAVSGGFTESIVRAISAIEKVPCPDCSSIRENNYEDYKEQVFNIQVGRRLIKFAICDGIASASEFLASDQFKKVDFIEVVACPMGCISGGGQPKLSSRKQAKKRMDTIYKIEKSLTLQSSFQNESLIKLMGTFNETKNGNRPSLQVFKTHFEPQESAYQARRHLFDVPVIAYGSTMGRATRYSRLVAGFMNAPSSSLNSINPNVLLEKKLAIFIISTIGKGEYPANSIRFINALEKFQGSLSNLQYCVLALGRTQAGHDFCAAGKGLDALMLKYGAKPLLPLTMADSSDEDGGESVYAKWSNDLATALYLKKPRVCQEVLNSVVKVDDESLLEKPSRPTGFEAAQIVERSLMSPEGYIPAMHKYTLQLPEGMTYEAGDHVVVLPCNDAPIADAVIKALNLQKNEVVSIQTGDPIIPGKVSINQLFVQFLDMNALPTLPLFQAFYEVANEEGKQYIGELLKEGSQKYKEYIEDTNTNETILDLSKYGIPPLDVLISVITHMQPRYYSIASAPDAHRGFLDLMVLDARFGQDDKRHGLCTHYLQHPTTERVYICCKRGLYRYPAESDSPVIMVALGSGVSPMFSLIQYRQTTDKPLGPAYLFFGAKYQAAYPLLLKKLHNFKNTKVIDELFLAFSRDGSKKYVQDLMKENSAKLWELWANPKTQFFYCGPPRDIPKQLKDIMLNITMSEGWLSIEEAMAYNSRHEWHLSSV